MAWMQAKEPFCAKNQERIEALFQNVDTGVPLYGFSKKTTTLLQLQGDMMGD
jgi:hypothetical protein